MHFCTAFVRLIKIDPKSIMHFSVDMTTTSSSRTHTKYLILVRLIKRKGGNKLKTCSLLSAFY